MVEQSRTRVKLMLASLVVALAAGYAYWWHCERVWYAETSARFRAKTAKERCLALQDTSAGNLVAPSELIIARLGDHSSFVRARAYETVYRTASYRKLPMQRLDALQRAARDEPELNRRWALALIVALRFQIGFEIVVELLPSMKTPLSRPFLLHILALHAQRDPKARDFLEEEATRKGSGAQVARDALTLLKLPQQLRVPNGFPKQLRVDVHPEDAHP